MVHKFIFQGSAYLLSASVMWQMLPATAGIVPRKHDNSNVRTFEIAGLFDELRQIRRDVQEVTNTIREGRRIIQGTRRAVDEFDQLGDDLNSGRVVKSSNNNPCRKNGSQKSVAINEQVICTKDGAYELSQELRKVLMMTQTRNLYIDEFYGNFLDKVFNRPVEFMFENKEEMTLENLTKVLALYDQKRWDYSKITQILFSPSTSKATLMFGKRTEPEIVSVPDSIGEFSDSVFKIKSKSPFLNQE
ncbi:hypothetical protein [Moorena producens]|uniref:hypothetical protein n=1 Tax=Moorena producens TaxID=1155739 RepID=UPI003C727803